MRVSEYFHLNRTQPTLDFVDVDIRDDLRLFVDPRALRLLPSDWAAECVALIQNFFRHVIHEIQDGHNDEAEGLLATLREPNEVHLGLSQGRSRGTALGDGSAHEVWQALRTSEAVQSGLLEDLEDTILMVPGISSDRVSDIAINLIREPLIHYTQAQAALHGIPLTDGVDSGPLWNPAQHHWHSRYTQLPITTEGKLLFVPKSIVRRKMAYDEDEYYRHYILEHLRRVELDANSALVELLKNGNRRVTKKALIEKYGRGKDVVVNQTLQNPHLLQQYRTDKADSIPAPLSHDDLAHDEGTERPNWGALLQNVLAIQPGNDGATAYERAVEALLTALFYPALSYPEFQFPIHNGRKRIDVKFTNTDQAGFFWWLGQHYPAAHIFVECKNYTREVANPELDQLAGRFSPMRGQVGLLLCRNLDDKNLFIQRCRDTALDGHGYIIPLDDDDLQELVAHAREAAEAGNPPTFPLLRERFERLVM
jgi:hypothetical protein